MIEFRWILPTSTTTDQPILQWRLAIAVDASGAFCPGTLGDWNTVPVVVVPPDYFKEAKK